MTLVNNDEVEEIRSKFFEKAFAICIFGNRLIDREIDVPRLTDLALSDLETCIAERCKVFCHRIIDQDASIGQIENFGLTEIAAPVPASIPELPTDLKCHLCLSGAGT